MFATATKQKRLGAGRTFHELYDVQTSVYSNMKKLIFLTASDSKDSINFQNSVSLIMSTEEAIQLVIDLTEKINELKR